MNIFCFVVIAVHVRKVAALTQNIWNNCTFRQNKVSQVKENNTINNNKWVFCLFTHTSDQSATSPYNIDTLSSTQDMRI